MQVPKISLDWPIAKKSPTKDKNETTMGKHPSPMGNVSNV
jgi:hypothetical protein